MHAPHLLGAQESAAISTHLQIQQDRKALILIKCHLTIYQLLHVSLGSWAKCGKWQCSGAQRRVDRSAAGSAERWTPGGWEVMDWLQKKRRTETTKVNKQASKQANKQNPWIEWMNQRSSKFFCKMPDSKCFMLSRPLQSVLQLLSSAILFNSMKAAIDNI